MEIPRRVRNFFRLINWETVALRFLFALGVAWWLCMAYSAIHILFFHGMPDDDYLFIVAKNGKGDYTTIAEAVAAAPSFSTQKIRIRVTAGTYEENVQIPLDKSNLGLYGDGINWTIVTSNRSSDQGFGDDETATISVMGRRFTAESITFRNTAGPTKDYATAIRSRSHQSVYYRCAFEGYQHTLKAESGYQFYKDCNIFGTNEIIYGEATVVFQTSTIYVHAPLPGQPNVITAQERNSEIINSGFSFHRCAVKKAPDYAPLAETYLGRRPLRSYPRVAFLETYMEDLVSPGGWLEWPTGSTPGALYFGEYQNTGPGADVSKRAELAGRLVINSTEEASQFTVGPFIQGHKWLPESGVPFISGL